MTRTQIFLTESEIAEIRSLAARMGMKQSALIRAALDEYLVTHRDTHRKALLAAGRGLWKNRRDLPDFRCLRREWDQKRLA
ncbi:MAG: ribbon-helix-helix protein, CopG family [Acidobacteria bacterium]|nr:ribbon-helix-helix protein, CopG family [Acidobacteriota bacterium]